MSKLMEYVDALAGQIGPRPATTDSEYRAAEWIKAQFESHDLAPTVQEFDSPRTYSWAFVIYNAATLIAAIVSGVAAWLTVVALVLSVVSAILLWLDLDTRWSLSSVLSKGPSQNVIARHVPSAARGGRTKKIVIVAHYDSARSSLAFSPSMVTGFPVTFALMKWCTWVTPVLILAQLLVPAVATVWVWYATMAAAAYLLVPIAINIHREIAMPYVDGANDNASGVACMLGVLDRVLPLEGEEEDYQPQLFGQEALEEFGLIPEGAAITYEGVPSSEAASAAPPLQADEDEYSDADGRLPGIDPRPQHTRPGGAADLGATIPFTPVEAPALVTGEAASFDVSKPPPIHTYEPAAAVDEQGLTDTFATETPQAPAAPVMRSATGELSELDLDALLPPIDVPEAGAIHDAEEWNAGQLHTGLTEEFTAIPESRFHEFTEFATGMFKRIVPKRNKSEKDRDEDSANWLDLPAGDARAEGRRIGKWSEFNDEDDDGWAGGGVGIALGEVGYESVSETVTRIRETVLAISDRDLREKEIWFVATGAEEVGTVGMQAFLSEYGADLRDALIINIDNVSGGDLCFAKTEGMAKRRRSDRRIQSLVNRASRKTGVTVRGADYKGLSTDASPALTRGFAAMTLIALDQGIPADWHWKTDTVANVDADRLREVVSLVAEAIRES